VGTAQMTLTCEYHRIMAKHQLKARADYSRHVTGCKKFWTAALRRERIDTLVCSSHNSKSDAKMASSELERLPIRAAATQYCSACMARLTGLRYQERAKRVHKMLVWRRLDAPLAPLSQRSHFPDLSDVLSQSTAHNTCKLRTWAANDLFAGKK